MKKNKILFFILALFVVSNSVNAQIEKEIRAYVDSLELSVNNGRKMLWQKIQERDFQKVAEIYDYLTFQTNINNCCAFTYNEDLLIASIIKDWSKLLEHFANFSEVTRTLLCYQIRDNIFRFLYDEVNESAIQLLEISKNDNNLTYTDKEVLELYFYLVGNGQDATFDKKKREFKKKNPNSIYNDFVNNYLPAPSPKIGLNFGMGATEIFPTRNLNNYFSPATVFNVTLDIYADKFFFSLQADGGQMKLFTPLSSELTGYEESFEKNYNFRYSNVGGLFGYIVARNEQIRFAPYVYLGGIYLMSNLYKSDEKDLEFKFFDSFFAGPGLRTDVKLIAFNLKDRYMTMTSSLALRLDVGYNFPAKFHYFPAKGDVFYTRLALVWIIGDF